MKCPFCGTEMRHGYLNVGMALWSEQKHSMSLNAAEGEKFALQLDRPLCSPHHVESDYCTVCKRIILDASPYHSNMK